jgi:hypothetical protein
MVKQQLHQWTYRFGIRVQQVNRKTFRKTSWVVSLMCLAGVGVAPVLAQTGASTDLVELAQTYELAPPPPDGAIPVPSSGAMPPSSAGSSAGIGNQNFSGQQYVVFVNGGSDLLLEQVRVVEPTAFRTNHQGQTVIQAGRFNSPQNANSRLNELSMQGIGGTVAEVPTAFPYYAQTPIQSPEIYASNGELPPIPTGAVPQINQGMANPQPVPQLPPVTSTAPATTQLPPVTSTVPSAAMPAIPGQGSLEFGQELAYSVPPSPGSYPVNTTPPGAAAAIPPGSARISAPYYVVIPTPENNLPELSTQIIQLGTPADRVQQRLTPRGPHVAVGPFEDRGLAFQWQRFYRDAGIANSRVHYDP